MKKLSFLLLSLLAVTLFTSCNKSDEPVNKQTLTATINSRAIDGDQVVFSQGSAKVELNFTDMMIQFTADYKDADGMSHSITTPDMKLTNTGGTVYSFNHSASQQDAPGLEGTLDMGTGMMWYTFNNGGAKVVSSFHLLYAYTVTTMTNPDNGNHGSHEQSAYLFAPDARGETCVMQISNFMSTLNSVVDASEVQYAGLTLTPTATGYKITADKAESTNYKGFYTLTDVDITLNNQALFMTGSFKCNGLTHEITGGLFKKN